jgi:hypothetical protein
VGVNGRDNFDLQRQIDELVERVDINRGDIDGLIRRADRAEARADAANRRADDMEERSALDRELIAELQAEGVLSQEHVAELQEALVSSRTIGAAIGILMASRQIGQDDALTVLKEASQRTNTKLRSLAETLVADAEVARPTS